MRATTGLTLCLLLLSGCAQDAGSQRAGSMFATSRASVGRASGQLLLADLNGDRRPDLITLHPLDSVIRIHAGDGRGGFAAAKTIRQAWGAGDVKLSDVNGDRAPDIVLTATDHDAVAVLLADERGDFRLAPHSPFRPTERRYRFNKRSLHVADFNGDGKPDLIAANRRGQTDFQVMLGLGDGSFRSGPVLRLDSARATYTLGTGDFDGDGKLDLAVASGGTDQGHDAGSLALWLGDGAGAFRRAAESLAVPSRSRVELVDDVDGDGLIDVLISHEGSSLTLVRGLGKGRLSVDGDARIDFGARAHGIALADMDRDGRKDLVAALGDAVAVLLATPRGFIAAPGTPFRAGPGSYDVSVIDVDGDARPDVVASSFEGTAATVLLNQRR